MATGNLIARGIGFSPGSVKFIVTHGLDIGAPPVIEPNLSVPKLVRGSVIPKAVRDSVVSGIIKLNRIIKVVRR